MKAKYRLKPYNEVNEHHFICEETWNRLANCDELEAVFLRGIFSESAIIRPKGTNFSLEDTFIVDRDDLREVRECNKCAKEKNESLNPAKEKSYTKDEVRKAAMRVVSNAELDEDDAIASAVALAKLIKELN